MLIYLELVFEFCCWDLKFFSFFLIDNFLLFVNFWLLGIRIFIYLSMVLVYLLLFEYSYKWNSGFCDVFLLRSYVKRGNLCKYLVFGREIIFIELYILDEYDWMILKKIKNIIIRFLNIFESR